MGTSNTLPQLGGHQIMVPTTMQSFRAVQVTALTKTCLPLPRPPETTSGFQPEKRIVFET